MCVTASQCQFSLLLPGAIDGRCCSAFPPSFLPSCQLETVERLQRKVRCCCRCYPCPSSHRFHSHPQPSLLLFRCRSATTARGTSKAWAYWRPPRKPPALPARRPAAPRWSPRRPSCSVRRHDHHSVASRTCTTRHLLTVRTALTATATATCRGGRDGGRHTADVGGPAGARRGRGHLRTVPAPHPEVCIALTMPLSEATHSLSLSSHTHSLRPTRRCPLPLYVSPSRLYITSSLGVLRLFVRVAVC